MRQILLVFLVVLTSASFVFAAPNATNDTASTNESTRIIINLTGNDQGSDLRIGSLSDPPNGTVVDNGDGTVNYTPDYGFFGNDTFNYTLLESGLYSNDTGHYYEFVTAGSINWTAANQSASTRNFSGLQGYLATVTSAAENTFISDRLEGQGWMGATDTDSEGAWYWVTGPEAGTHFWQGAGAGSAVSGRYQNWNPGEPNNAGDEDYAHFLANGLWNDYPHAPGGTIQGYVVEYGGMAGDNATFAIGNVTVSVAPVAPTINISSPQNTTYNLTRTITLNVSANKNISAWWYNINGSNVTFTPNTTLSLNNSYHTIAVYANATNGLVGNASRVFTVAMPDEDSDNVSDYVDSFIGNESTVISDGVQDLNITVDDIAANDTYSGLRVVTISNGTQPLVNFTHNFTNSTINLSKITVILTETTLVINTSGQVSNKTLYFADLGFESLCVEDAPISNSSDISEDCSGVNETDFTSCLGGSYNASNITCQDLGSVIKIGNLTHSGVRGTLPEEEEEESSSSSGGGGSSYSLCGNGVCNDNFGESCTSCSRDCGACSTAPSVPAVDIGSTEPVENSEQTTNNAVQTTVIDSQAPQEVVEETTQEPTLQEPAPQDDDRSFVPLLIFALLLVGVTGYLLFFGKRRKRRRD